MRKPNSISTKSVVGIVVLCNVLTVQIAWAADTWSVSMPTDASVRTKTANVPGNGLTSAADGTKAVFSWLRDDGEDLVPESFMLVSANFMSWSGTLNPPQAGWHVSPKDITGMYIADHYANLSWGSPTLETGTSDHVVTE